jgi:hypothetical protein
MFGAPPPKERASPNDEEDHPELGMSKEANPNETKQH